MPNILPTIVAFSLCSFGLIAADTAAIDKSQYTLFNPTPRDAMRPLSSDQADRVVGPYTVDAGHLQIESDLVDYLTVSEDVNFPGGHFKFTEDRFNWAPSVKIGLCNRTDFEVKFSYNTITSDLSAFSANGAKVGSASRTQSGFGAVFPTLKINLWGNDGGDTAMALTPFLTIPTEGNFDVTGGVGAPFAWNLPEDFTLKVSPELFFFENGRKTLYAGFDGAVAVHKTMLYPNLDLFGNFTSQFTAQSSREWLGYTGFGGSYNFTPDLQLYLGIRFGLTSNAYDYNPYFGFTWRY